MTDTRALIARVERLRHGYRRGRIDTDTYRVELAELAERLRAAGWQAAL